MLLPVQLHIKEHKRTASFKVNEVLKYRPLKFDMHQKRDATVDLT